MPKIEGGLQDISTERRVAPEGIYAGQIKSITLAPNKNGKPMFTIETQITEGEYSGMILSKYLTLQTKEGKKNEGALRELKILVTDVLGEERANNEDFDTDELLDQVVGLYVAVESYEDKVMKETVNTNNLKRIMNIDAVS